MTLICGIDEAGRGPVIGPLVICGVLINTRNEPELKRLGTKDSKLLTAMQREFLSKKIKKIAKRYKVLLVSPEEIDKAVESETDNLNWLEARKIIEIIDKLNPETAYIDCPSNNIKKYTSYLKDRIKNKRIKLIAEHKADFKYVSVSAASIIAKDTRDKEIEKIKKKHNVEFGSGYPSDPITQKFLAKNYKKYDFFRKSWMSWKEVAKSKGQKKLGEF